MIMVFFLFNFLYPYILMDERDDCIFLIPSAVVFPDHDVVKIPPSIPSAGCVCRDDLLQWHVLLSQRREMRLRRREKEDDYGRVAVWNEEESFFNSSTSNNNAAAATESLLGILIHEL